MFAIDVVSGVALSAGHRGRTCWSEDKDRIALYEDRDGRWINGARTRSHVSSIKAHAVSEAVRTCKNLVQGDVTRNLLVDFVKSGSVLKAEQWL